MHVKRVPSVAPFGQKVGPLWALSTKHAWVGRVPSMHGWGEYQAWALRADRLLLLLLLLFSLLFFPPEPPLYTHRKSRSPTIAAAPAMLSRGGAYEGLGRVRAPSHRSLAVVLCLT